MKGIINRRASKKVTSYYRDNRRMNMNLNSRRALSTGSDEIKMNSVQETSGNKIYDFYTTQLKIKGIEAPCLLFECRHNEALKLECQMLGYTVFDIRHTENDWATPCNIEKSVLVNFWGYIALKDDAVVKLLNQKLDKDGFFQVNNRTLNRFDSNIAEYHSDSPLPASL